MPVLWGRCRPETGVTLGIVQILWQIYMLILLLKDSLPGKQTRASHSLLHPRLFFFFLINSI